MPPRAIHLREGRAPIRDRLLTMAFFAAVVHGVIILGLTFNSSPIDKGGAPGLEVLLVSDELPTADSNPGATYLAQRTQIGSGNTRAAVAPRNRAASVPVPHQEGTPEGDSLSGTDERAGDAAERVLSTTTWSSQVTYLADPGTAGQDPHRPLLLDEPQTEQPGPQDDGPARLRGPAREELWVTPDTRASLVAPYLDAWRRKVERIGTLNYPTAARQSGAQASPVMEVGIAADGHLDRAVIRRSSGDAQLDAAALSILKLASPFDPFPPELAHQYGVLRFAYEWQFVGGRLERGGVSTLP